MKLPSPLRLLIPFATALLAGTGTPASAATGDVEAAFNPGLGPVSAILLKPDGRIMTAGANSNSSGTARWLNADGSLSLNLITIAEGSFNSAVLLEDDSLFLGGGFISNSSIMRFTPAGDFDSSFDVRNPPFGPFAFIGINTLAFQNDSTFLAGGFFEVIQRNPRRHLARFSGGGLDSFDPNPDSAISAIAVQPDGKILISGAFNTLGNVARPRMARLDGNTGSIDTTFNADPNVGADCIAVQPDGKILIGGSFTQVNGSTRNYLARLNANGTLDTGFDAGFAAGENQVVFTVCLQADGHVIAGGRFSSVGGQPRQNIVRLNANGTLDPSFHPDANNTVFSTVLQSDGKLLVGGMFTTIGGVSRNGLARIENEASTQTLTAVSVDRLRWVRGGTAPEIRGAVFEFSNDSGADWAPLGTGVYTGNGTWELTGLNLPQTGLLRARARITGSIHSGDAGKIAVIAPINIPANVPEISVEQPQGVLLTDGGASDFGNLIIGTSTTRTFVVTNLGSGDLTGVGVTITGANASDFTVTVPPAAIVEDNGGVTFFIVKYAPTTVGSKTAVLRISSNDADENPFDISLAGLANENVPEIVVEQPAGTTMNDGGAVSFGSASPGMAVSRMFTVKNTGLGVMTGVSAAIDGPNAGRFSLLTLPAATVNPGGTTTFTIGFEPLVVGTYSAAVHISSNDADENPFDISLTATGALVPGTPDLTFGTGSSIASANAYVKVMRDGRILTHTIGPSISRFLPNGTPDLTFGTGGTAPMEFYLSVAVQEDGKIVGVGAKDNDVAVTRLNADGSLDTAFGSGGMVKTNIRMGSRLVGMQYVPEPSLDSGVAIAVGADGKIVVVGTAVSELGRFFNPVHMGIIRYNPDGTLDTSFNASGIVEEELSQDAENYPGTLGAATDVAVQFDRKIVAAAWSVNKGLVLKRYAPNGILDSNLSRNLRSGYAFPNHDVLNGIAVNHFGGVVGTGIAQTPTIDGFPHYFALAGFGGATFTTIGEVDGYGTSVALQPNGRILVAGKSFSRFLTDGTADPSFTVSGYASSVALQPDGHILVINSHGLQRLYGDSPFPEIAIEQPADTGLTDGASFVVFPAATAGETVTRTFTIKNVSAPNLSVFGAYIDGPSAADYTLTVPPPGNIPGNGSATFTVSYQPATLNSGAAVLHVGSRDFDEGSFDIALSRVPPAPEITVEQPAGTLLESGSGPPVNFGQIAAGSTATRTFTIRNEGNDPLTGLAITKAATGTPAEFSVSLPGAASLDPGASTTFTLTYSPTAAPGARSVTLLIASNDADENPFSIHIIATDPNGVPDIALEDSSGPLPDAGTRKLRLAPPGGTASYTFTVRNSGTALLNGFAITFDGPQASEFSITRLPDASVPAGGTTTFAIRHSPLTPGVKTAALHLTSNVSGSKNPYDLSLIIGEPGLPDDSFHPAASDYTWALAGRPEGILVDFSSNNFVSLDRGGNPFPGFIVPSIDSNITAIAVQKDGKIIVGGSFTTIGGQSRRRIARLLPNGTVDPAFNANFALASYVAVIRIQPDGKILVGGGFPQLSSSLNLVRLNTDGALDPLFTPALDEYVQAMALQPDGKILVEQSLNRVPADWGPLLRFNPDGTRDPDFVLQGPFVAFNSIYGLTVQPDGKILAFGDFAGGILRCLPNGVRDDTMVIPSSRVYDAVLQADGKIIAGGDIGGSAFPHQNIIRLNADGSVNPSFTRGTNGTVVDLLLQSDGSIIAGGDFTSVDGIPANKFARLLNDPAFDSLQLAGPSTVRWMRGGSAPEVQDVTLDVRADGASTWTRLGTAQRIAGGWELSGLTLPVSGALRAQAFAEESLVESVRPFVLNLTSWRQKFFQTAANEGDAADSADFDRDGLTNFTEFAFGLSPVDRADGTLPQFVHDGSSFTASFTVPGAGRENVTYDAEWSTTMQSGNWTPVVDIGAGGRHLFSIPATDTRVFVRFVLQMH